MRGAAVCENEGRAKKAARRRPPRISLAATFGPPPRTGPRLPHAPPAAAQPDQHVARERVHKHSACFELLTKVTHSIGRPLSHASSPAPRRRSAAPAADRARHSSASTARTGGMARADPNTDFAYLVASASYDASVCGLPTSHQIAVLSGAFHSWAATGCRRVLKVGDGSSGLDPSISPRRTRSRNRPAAALGGTILQTPVERKKET